MPYQEMSSFNVTGAHGIFTYVADTVPIFFPLTLFALFIIVLLGTYFSQRNSTGRADIFSSLAVAGYFVSLVALIMSLVGGLIQPMVVIICFTVSIITTIILLLNKASD